MKQHKAISEEWNKARERGGVPTGLKNCLQELEQYSPVGMVFALHTAGPMWFLWTQPGVTLEHIARSKPWALRDVAKKQKEKKNGFKKMAFRQLVRGRFQPQTDFLATKAESPSSIIVQSFNSGGVAENFPLENSKQYSSRVLLRCYRETSWPCLRRGFDCTK